MMASWCSFLSNVVNKQNKHALLLFDCHLMVMVLLYWSGLPEECKVQTPAFTDAVRLYRQAHGQYGTWDMMCGTPPQVTRTLYI